MAQMAESKPLRILLVEDSEDDAILLLRALRRGGFDPQVKRVDNRYDTYAALQEPHWDLVITDHNMPGFNSNDVIAMVKELRFDKPVIVVSGSIGEDIAVTAMKSGAHDYIMKDNLMRLVPAIERELREAETRRAHRKAEETIRYMAYHDSLTGLTNRHSFEQRLEQALQSARASGLSHGLLYLDLDQFKIINDTCGHEAGDELLKQLTVVLRRSIRHSDVLARLGGDEFGVLLEKCPIDRTMNIAETLVQAVRNFRFVWNRKTFAIGVSVGLVQINSATKGLKEVLSAADMACYAAKDEGRSRIHVYHDEDAVLRQRHGEMEWVSLINRALEENRFVLFQQCIVPLAQQGKNKLNYEFLLRMSNGDGDHILPGAFIPAAERFDLMSRLDRWVIDAAFSYLSKILDSNPSPAETGTFFINISGTSLSDESFFVFVRDQLSKYSIPPKMVAFEITETAAIANLSKAVRFIEEIRDAGCYFALDDFGSGLSSFSYLKTIPVDFIKIDGLFVEGMLKKPIDAAIVKAINQIGHEAGLKTIAEWVENAGVKSALQAIGVDYAQGFGIEKPRKVEVS
ncbi:MAG: EAL domain-containing protein [Myxococcota bacterium]|nr:EAL domain-containing protein [Myxococcota bacterium]